MTPSQLDAFEARMAARAAREAATPPPAPPRVAPPMPGKGARPCRACSATGRVAGGKTCPSCLGAGWKWLPDVQEVGVDGAQAPAPSQSKEKP